jgi:cell division protein FtsL
VLRYGRAHGPRALAQPLPGGQGVRSGRILADLSGLLKRVRVPRRLLSGVTASLHTRGFVLWVAALVTGILCVTQHVYSTKLAEQIEDLRREKAEVRAEIGFLEMEHSKLMSRERIEEYASERLGMRYPRAHEVVRLGVGTRPTKGGWDRELVEVNARAFGDG